MQFREASLGRVFIIRLEHGDVLHESVEKLAKEQSVRAAALIVLGGADKGSTLVVGPADGQARPVLPMERMLDDVHEVCGTGTLFPGEKGDPVLHMHISAGRTASTVTGCVRRGVRVWQVMEVILIELLGAGARRVLDEALGFELMKP
jgi:predicted DNA-binding protein with PD1-like motif